MKAQMLAEETDHSRRNPATGIIAEGKTMKTRKGAAILSALLYAQGLLGLAAVAAVLLQAPATHTASHVATVQMALHQPAR